MATDVRGAPAPARRRLPPPRWTGSTMGVLIHATIALALALDFATEGPTNFTAPVWDGPRRIMAWVPGSAWTDWAVVFAVPALLIVAGRGRPWTRWALFVQALVCAAFGGSAAVIGATSPIASCVAGILDLGLVALAIKEAVALGRRRR